MMSSIRTLATAFAAAFLLAQAASAAGLPSRPVLSGAVPALVEADCFSVGQDVAASKGGELLKAEPDTRNGTAVCVIIVLVPGKAGGRPRREEVVVPAG